MLLGASPIFQRAGRGQRLDGKTNAGPTRGAAGRGGTDQQSQTAAGLGRQLQPAKGTIVSRGDPSQHGVNARLAEQLIEGPGFILATSRADDQQARADNQSVGDGRRIERSLGIEDGQHPAGPTGLAGGHQGSGGSAAARSGGQPFDQASALQAAAGEHLVEQGRTGADRGQAGGKMALLELAHGCGQLGHHGGDVGHFGRLVQHQKSPLADNVHMYINASKEESFFPAPKSWECFK
jgi:hypothetical protein